MSPVELERRIIAEGMEAIEPGERPSWARQWDGDAQPLVWTMDTEGRASPSWTRLDEVDWHDVAAVRMEGPYGVAITIARLIAEDDFSFPDAV